MTQVKNGDTVQVNYTGKLTDGTVFDSTADRQPLQFTVGEGRLIPGFEKAVLGMEQGTQKTAHIPTADAYGPPRADMLMAIERQQLPENITPEVGQQLQVQHNNGQTTKVVVSEVHEDKVVLDGNHPLAGQDLIFDIELLAIV